MIVLRLARQSLLNRWPTALLTVLAIAVSVFLLLGVEKVRTGARASFANTITGTDLVVGARTGGIQLLLYTVFRIGNATNNISWQSYQEIAKRPEVAWIVPLSLGDSHRGYRVLGTSTAYFEHYRFRAGRKLAFASGKPFEDLFDAVIGADVAEKLGYTTGQRIIITHGIGAIGRKHDNKPFRIAGILARTGTPVDRTVHVSLEAIEAIHAGWRNGRPQRGARFTADDVRKLNLQPRAVTGALVGLKSKFATFGFQRFVNTYRAEPLTAILPGVTLYELWGIVSPAETALLIISGLVVITALLGMITMLLASLQERAREIAILRSVGAGPGTVTGMIVAETTMLTLAGTALGVAALYGSLYALRPMIDAAWGLYIEIRWLTRPELLALAAIVGGGFLAGLIPAWRATRMRLAQGMMVTR